MKSAILLFTLLSVIFSQLMGCSRGFNRDLQAAQLEKQGLQIVGEDIERIVKTRPQLHVPFSVGISLSYNNLQFRKQVDNQLTPAFERLVADRIVSNFSIVDGEDSNNSVRAAAAQHGFDTVLVLGVDTQIDSYANPFSILYLTLVGMWIVPGSHVDALSEVRASLYDTLNGFIYLGARAQGEASKVRPLALLEESDAKEESRAVALKEFAPELERRLRNLAVEIGRMRSR